MANYALYLDQTELDQIHVALLNQREAEKAWLAKYADQGGLDMIDSVMGDIKRITHLIGTIREGSSNG
jgi:hypothetical protein